MGGTTFQLTQESKRNLDIQMTKLKKVSQSEMKKGIVSLLFQIKTLSQLKLKYDTHIVTSRLRNSIYVQTAKPGETNRPDNTGSYSDKDGKTYKSKLDVSLTDKEGAVGTNVEYAGKIEYLYDSFLYWALKNVDMDKTWRQISDNLLGGLR